MSGLIRQLILVITCSVAALWVGAETYRVDVIQLPTAESSSTLSETLNRVDWGAVGRSTKTAWDKMGNESKSENSSSSHSGSALLIIGVIVGAFLVLALLYALFSSVFGGRCVELRSQDGLLVDVKKPRSIILALTVFYSLSIISLALALFQINTRQGDLTVLVLSLLALFLFLPLSVSLHIGSRTGRNAAGIVCCIAFICFVSWGYARVESGMDWGYPSYVGMLISAMMGLLLVLPQTDQWLSAKEELRQNKQSEGEVNQ